MLYMDADVILLRNPFPYLWNITGMDVIAQGYRNGVLCSGFMYFKATNNSISLLTIAHDYAIQHTNNADQYAIHVARRKVVVPIHLLSPDLFPVGEDFFRRYQFYWDMKKDNQFYIFHNNDVRGSFGKQLLLKEMRLYSFDTDGEYSGDNTFLTLEVFNTSML